MLDHFAGKSAEDHVRQAAQKGIAFTAETHGAEIPGTISSFFDAAKDSVIAGLLVWAATEHWTALVVFSCGWVIWKGGLRALMAWARLERLHRLIEEERWEIEHHRGQERMELEALYARKGFSGKLLTEVVDVLMADEDRLLQVMLEEELGLTLETYDHPLKQATGAFLGAFCTLFFLCISSCFFGWYGIGIVGGLGLSALSWIDAKMQKNTKRSTLIWHLSLGALSVGAVYFLRTAFL